MKYLLLLIMAISLMGCARPKTQCINGVEYFDINHNGFIPSWLPRFKVDGTIDTCI